MRLREPNLEFKFLNFGLGFFVYKNMKKKEINSKEGQKLFAKLIADVFLKQLIANQNINIAKGKLFKK